MDDLETYYQELFDTFDTPGWKHVMEMAQEILEDRDNVIRVSNERDLYIKQGEIKNLIWLLNLEEDHKKAYDDLRNDMPEQSRN